MLCPSDLDVAGLRSAMSEAMHGDAVNIEGSGDRVTLSGKVGSDAQADTAVKLAGLYSKEVANALTVSPDHPKQVRLKVRILEVDRSKAEQYGHQSIQSRRKHQLPCVHDHIAVLLDRDV